MIVPKNPIPKESGGQGSTNATEGNGFLNTIDKFTGMQPGFSVEKKNKLYNLKKEGELLQEKVDDVDGEIKSIETLLVEARKNNDNEKIKYLTEKLEAIKKKKADLGQQQAANSNEQKTEKARKISTQPLECDSIFSIFGDSRCFESLISKGTNIIFSFVSFLAYVSGVLFDYSLEFSINSAEFFNKIGVVEVTWSFIRDILNMTFIFILLWTAIQILLGNDSKYNVKQILSRVIIVAILMNFSLFAAKLMVDGSNIVSLKIYESMKATPFVEKGRASVSERVMNTVGLSPLYNITKLFEAGNIKADSACANNPRSLIIISVLGSIFLLVLCLAFGLAAILFLIRLVNIIVLFVKSPLWVWGYVLPGNSSIEKHKDKWWSEMKHVLSFPIVYLFWMLVAIIVFEKLGKVKGTSSGSGNQVTLLDLICGTSMQGGFGQSISLVAIFVIVIIFMMMAIKYAMESGTSDGMIGKGLAKSAIDRFSGYQTAITRGLTKSLINKTPNISVGAARHGLSLTKNTVGRLGGGVLGSIKGNKGWEGFKDGFSDPGIKTKEVLRDIARNQVAKGGIIGELTGLTSAAAKYADKNKDPKNSQGKTKKEMDKMRTKAASEDERLRTEAIENVYKVSSFKDWKKQNPNGTIDNYKKETEDIVRKRFDKIFGKGIADEKNADGISHIEALRARMFKEGKDKNGNDTVTLNERSIQQAIPKIMEYHTTGEGKPVNKKRLTIYTNIRSKARIEAITEYSKEKDNKLRSKQTSEDRTSHLENTISFLESKIEKMPTENDIDNCVKNNTKYTGKGHVEVQELNKAIEEYNRLSGQRNISQSTLDDAKEKIQKQKDIYMSELKKQQTELSKNKNSLEDHLAKIEKSKENK